MLQAQARINKDAGGAKYVKLDLPKLASKSSLKGGAAGEKRRDLLAAWFDAVIGIESSVVSSSPVLKVFFSGVDHYQFLFHRLL